MAMSNGRDPTLADVILGLQRIQDDVTTMRGELDSVRGELTGVRVALMDRMDRLQNAMTAMREEQTVLNGLVLSNQKMAERGLGESRLALDQTTTLAQTISALQMQIRQLRADVDEIRDRPHG